MKPLNRQSAIGFHQPGPITWESVPDFIQNALIAQGCILLHHPCKRPRHIRFQYVPLFYKGYLYYLQRWSHDEWGVSPSEILFPEGSPCPMEVLDHGSLLSLLVKKAVAQSYGLSPDDASPRPGPQRLPLAC